ncbi:MAG: amidase family protein, partial [Phycisphaeraceae bacterium]|nr:amidase family protein [Phycisphaeraceae bacterium]
GAAPHSINSTGDPRMNLLGTYTGCPTLTLPMRLSDRGLPLGMQLIAMRGAEMSLLGAGALIERAIAFDQTPPAP